MIDAGFGEDLRDSAQEHAVQTQTSDAGNVVHGLPFTTGTCWAGLVGLDLFGTEPHMYESTVHVGGLLSWTGFLEPSFRRLL